MFNSPPVSADDDVCAGTGTLVTSAGLGVPGTVTTSSFSLSVTTGTCLNEPFPGAGGTITGSCGQFEGQGTTDDGHSFVLTTAGGTTLVTGDLRGVMSIVEDPADSGSCTTGTASRFQVAVSVRLQVPLCPPGFEVTEQVNFYRPGVFNIHWWACIPNM